MIDVFDPLMARLVYGAVMGLVLVLAWRSGYGPVQRLAGWMLVAWAAFNGLYEVLGPKGEALLVALTDALICIPVANLAIRYHFNAAWSVVSVFGITAAWSLLSWWEGWAGGTAFYLVLNLLFLVRMAVVGTDAGVRLADRRSRQFRGADPVPGAGS